MQRYPEEAAAIMVLFDKPGSSHTIGEMQKLACRKKSRPVVAGIVRRLVDAGNLEPWHRTGVGAFKPMVYRKGNGIAPVVVSGPQFNVYCEKATTAHLAQNPWK